VRVLEALNPVRVVQGLWGSRSLMWQFARREVLARNRGSALGVGWTLLHPLIMLAVYTFIFAIVWEARWEGHGADAASTGVATKVEFALALFSGLLAFDVFAASVNSAPSAVVNNPNLVKKVVFPLELLPLSTLMASVVLHGAGLVVLLLANAILRGTISHTLWAYPLVLLPLVLLAGGISLACAALGVFVRDLRTLVPVATQVLFFITPILYPVSKLAKAPQWMQQVLALNPLIPIFESARAVLVFGGMPHWAGLGWATLLGVVVFVLGHALFVKSKRGFADVL
jgi:lipopolysaccharide transport system permease protein